MSSMVTQQPRGLIYRRTGSPYAGRHRTVEQHATYTAVPIGSNAAMIVDQGTLKGWADGPAERSKAALPPEVAAQTAPPSRNDGTPTLTDWHPQPERRGLLSGVLCVAVVVLLAVIVFGTGWLAALSTGTRTPDKPLITTGAALITITSPAEDSCARPDYSAAAWHVCDVTVYAPTEDSYRAEYDGGKWSLIPND